MFRLPGKQVTDYFQSRQAPSQKLSAAAAAGVSLSRRWESVAPSGHKPKTSITTKKNSNIVQVAPQDDEEPFSSKYGGLDDSEEREHVPKGDHRAPRSQVRHR